MNRYESAVAEVRSVLSEWDPRPLDDIIADKIVERLVAKGIIQSTDPDELVDPTVSPGGAWPKHRISDR